MKYKIIGFNKFQDSKEDSKCIAIDENGNEILVDPFVGCAFPYEKRGELLNTWFETVDEHWWDDRGRASKKVLLPSEKDFKVIQVIK